MLYDSQNCIVNISSNKLVVLQGLNDFIVVETENNILVCKKENEQELRNIVNDVMIKTGNSFI